MAKKWQWEEVTDNECYLSCIADGPGYCVTGMDNPERRSDRDKHYMRLIAAAPEMADLLAELLSAWENTPTPSSRKHLDELFERVRIAVAHTNKEDE